MVEQRIRNARVASSNLAFGSVWLSALGYEAAAGFVNPDGDGCNLAATTTADGNRRTSAWLLNCVSQGDSLPDWILNRPKPSSVSDIEGFSQPGCALGMRLVVDANIAFRFLSLHWEDGRLWTFDRALREGLRAKGWNQVFPDQPTV